MSSNKEHADHPKCTQAWGQDLDFPFMDDDKYIQRDDLQDLSNGDEDKRDATVDGIEITNGRNKEIFKPTMDHDEIQYAPQDSDREERNSYEPQRDLLLEPNNVRNTLKDAVKKPYKFAKRKYVIHQGTIKRIKLIFTIGLSVFDIISDLVLAVNYFINGDTWWGGLTLAFFILPFIVFLLFLYFVCHVCTRMKDENENENEHENQIDENLDFLLGILLQPRALECILEAGPQLILQLYIMALPAESTLSESNNTTYSYNATNNHHTLDSHNVTTGKNNA